MDDEYYVINKKVLPDYFEKVIEIKDKVSKGVNISDACREIGLSRSTFYKYKDYVNKPSKDLGKRVILSLKLNDEPGTLSNILNEINERHCNILTITQEMPVHNIAYVTLTIAVLELEMSVQALNTEIKKLPNVIDVTLLAVE
jgi:chorismate mutase